MTDLEATQTVIEALEAASLEYMVVGSLSSSYYGIPRSTQDADFVVASGAASFAALRSLLPANLRLDPQVSFEGITGTLRQVLHVEDSPFKVEFFRLSDDPHDRERFARRRRVQVPALGMQAVFPTPEDVVVTKLRWAVHGARSKDWEDIRDVIAVQGDEHLDWDYIHRWADTHGTRATLDDIRRSIPPLSPP